ncbi:MAG: hypothetical protein ACREFW_11225 [Rhizomicrobium sp.]
MLTAVDPSIFALRYFVRCQACSFCGDACCDHGVDIDVENAQRLRDLPQDFHDRVGVAPGEWFSGEPVPDEEFPGGAYLRTATRNGACIFRKSEDGRGCAIHAYCLEKGLDYHRFKPMVSVLFPVTFESGVLTAAAEAADGSLVCGGRGPSLYEGVRVEIAYYFGPDLISELDGLNKKWSTSQPLPT